MKLKAIKREIALIEEQLDAQVLSTRQGIEAYTKCRTLGNFLKKVGDDYQDANDRLYAVSARIARESLSIEKRP